MFVVLFVCLFVLLVASAATGRLVVSRRFSCFSVVPRRGGGGGEGGGFGGVGGGGGRVISTRVHCAAGECISASCRLFSLC